ncbi:Hypothetical protein ABZS17H1_00609 [Kosakonia cowanii]|jgi:hypothetical protein
MTAQYNPQIPGNVCTDKFSNFLPLTLAHGKIQAMLIAVP